MHMSWIQCCILTVLLTVLSLPAKSDWRHYGVLEMLPDVMLAGNIVAPTLAIFVAQDKSGDLSLVITLPSNPDIADTTDLAFTLPENKPYITEFHVLRRTATHIVLKTGDVDLIEILSGLQGAYSYVDVSSESIGQHRFDLTGITTALLGLATASLK
ncbi:hypothetical protein ElyMa_000445300 [Elysia marginata]|uniref:Uncharacterized protein n=1 Tax=Elysia marginata TaxID=1093978 RepID=A0AAV4FNP4_9GAST|nr:hypothetical protein ElyMa_000445300 [Elysia marginata]